MVTIINYGSGNIRAIGNIYDQLKISYRVAETADELLSASKIILPGVGAFDQTMSMLNKSGFISKLEELIIQKKIPVLGICVGMQIMAECSEEGGLPGLGWIKGRVRRFNKDHIPQKPKIPHLGWNSIKINQASKLFENINPDDGFYFIHSYYFECSDVSDVLTQTFYGLDFASAVNKNNIFGVQFHPEKSHYNGIALLKNFSEI
jgi:glutamine amidotransferase